MGWLVVSASATGFRLGNPELSSTHLVSSSRSPFTRMGLGLLVEKLLWMPRNVPHQKITVPAWYSHLNIGYRFFSLTSW